jgi:hypothetical protein
MEMSKQLIGNNFWTWSSTAQGCARALWRNCQLVETFNSRAEYSHFSHLFFHLIINLVLMSLEDSACRRITLESKPWKRSKKMESSWQRMNTGSIRTFGRFRKFLFTLIQFLVGKNWNLSHITKRTQKWVFARMKQTPAEKSINRLPR